MTRSEIVICRRGTPLGLHPVPLPASREQIKRLGNRLASGDPVPDDDLRLLEELVACHMTALELARPLLDGLAEAAGAPPLHITHRAKTTQTIIEKLRREHGMSLARMRDLAGIRIVGAITFAQQDALAAEIARRFPADPREPKLIDRRADPSHGYRAVHVEVTLDGVSIEVQVRTLMQHIWADLMERLADRLGRQIRYGEPPVPPPGMSLGTAETIVAGMMSIAEDWADEDQAIVGELPTSLDQVAESVWVSVSGKLRESGVDL